MRASRSPVCGDVHRYPIDVSFQMNTPNQTPLEHSHETTRNAFVIDRYKHAYQIAGAVNTAGYSSQRIGLVLGIAIALASFFLGRDGGILGVLAIIFAITFGTIIALFGYVAGTIVRAASQILYATLDQAVHSSPFLSIGEQAIAMSLGSDPTNAAPTSVSDAVNDHELIDPKLVSARQRLGQLRDECNAAIDREDFTSAAALRDQEKSLQCKLDTYLSRSQS